MKISKIGKYWWNKVIYATLDENENQRFQRGWSFITKEHVEFFTKKMNKTKTACIMAPRNGKVKIVYRSPGEKVFVIEEPRLPLFSLLMHHHGSQRSTVDEEYKCTRCGKEVPNEIKSLVMMESAFGLDAKENENDG